MLKDSLLNDNELKTSTLPKTLGEPLGIPGPRRPWVAALRIVLLFAIIASVLAGGISYLWLKNLGVFSLADGKIEEIRHHVFADNTIVFDRDGKRIGEFFDRYQIHVPVHELPPHLVEAITAIEDRTFYTHKGIDISAMFRAAWARLRHGRITQGGSTITQQVVKHLILSPERTLERKFLEIAWALKLEKELSKDEILEIYTNAMFLGNGSYGVGAAARRYFGKDVRHLDVAESAVIAGLFQSPSRYNPARHPERAKKRQRSVLLALAQVGHITKQEAKTLAAQTVQYHDYKPINYETAPWFIDWVREQLPNFLGKKYRNSDGSGLRVYTTLDPAIQLFAESSVQSAASNLASIESRTGSITDPKTGERRPARLEASMLVTDPRDGAVLAMVGGRNYRTSQFNRTTSAMRSPGSAFKPVVYTEALMRGWKWSDVIYVSPINIDNYKPHTPEDDFLTETTMLRAFYRSMNTPTVEISTRLGLPQIINRAKSLGIRSSIKNEFGSTLGSSDLTMLDLARVYGTIANSGKLVEIQGITKITTAEGHVLFEAAKEIKSKQVLPPQIAFLMHQGLRSVLTSGTGVKSRDLSEVGAGKTGTSNESADNWFCGYTENLTAMVWVGTDEHAPILGNVTGGALALPIWDTFLRQTLALRPTNPIAPPPGVKALTVHPRFGHLIQGGTPMWFLETNQPKQTSSALESIQAKSSGEYRRVFTH